MLNNFEFLVFLFLNFRELAAISHDLTVVFLNFIDSIYSVFLITLLINGIKPNLLALLFVHFLILFLVYILWLSPLFLKEH